MEIHRYTKEEQEFMKQYVPGHSHREINRLSVSSLDGILVLTRSRHT